MGLPQGLQSEAWVRALALSGPTWRLGFFIWVKRSEVAAMEKPGH